MTKSGKDYTFFIVGSTKTIKLGKKKTKYNFGDKVGTLFGVFENLVGKR